MMIQCVRSSRSFSLRSETLVSVIFLRSETLGAKNRQGFAKVPESRCPCAPTHKVRVSCETPMEVSIRSLLRSKTLACRALTRRAPRRYSTVRLGLGSKVSPKVPDSRLPVPEEGPQNRVASGHLPRAEGKENGNLNSS